jgi:hypothetical protein
MGGSSLCPEVLSETFGQLPGGPRVHVLDSTDPAQVAAVDASVDLSHTLVIVASKSGSTLEPNIFHAYFYQRMVEAVGAANAGRHFIGITDPGSKPDRRRARRLPAHRCRHAEHRRTLFRARPSAPCPRRRGLTPAMAHGAVAI